MVIPVIEMSEGEMAAARELLNSPVLNKYLRMLASEQVEVISYSAIDPAEAPEIFMRKLIHHKGLLAAYTGLLELAAHQPPKGE